MDLTEPSVESLRLKPQSRVLYDSPQHFADVDDLVEETLARFSRSGYPQLIRNTEELGALSNGIGRDLICEHDRRPGGARSRKVLIADDAPGSREFIRTVLEKCGHTVWEAVDGTDAVRSACEIQPDLIVLDLQMPALDGFGVLKELRSQQRFIRTPIVALTATAMQGDRDRALAAGFTGYISKPIGVCALRAEMQRWLAYEPNQLNAR